MVPARPLTYGAGSAAESPAVPFPVPGPEGCPVGPKSVDRDGIFRQRRRFQVGVDVELLRIETNLLFGRPLVTGCEAADVVQFADRAG